MTDLQQQNRLAAKEESRLNIKALSDPSNLKALETIFRTLKNCFGPFSSNIVLVNDLGGTVITTSSCLQLFNALPIENPLVRLVTTSTQGHGNNFSDGSLFTALLALALVQEGLKLDMHRHLISTVFELILHDCLAYLSRDNCAPKRRMSFESTGEMLKLAKCVIATKPGSIIDKDEVDQIARLVLVSFIRGISEKEVTNLHLVGVDGQQPMKSEVMSGFLYNAPELWSDENQAVCCRSVESGTRIRTVLVGCSMAGDSDDYIEAKYEMHGVRLRKEDVVLQQIKQWIDSVLKLDIGIVFCQKVVHNDIKELLQQHNIVAIERLGTKGANTVRRLTGGPLVHSLHSSLTLSQCGSVVSIEQLGLYDNTYLHVKGATDEVSTLLLCHYSEDALDELKASCDQAYSVLRACLAQPYALHGGGCWLTQLAHHVRHKAKDPSWLAAAECPDQMHRPIIHAFLRGLYRLPALLRTDRDHYVDTNTHHHWMLPPCTLPSQAVHCACGAVEWNEDVVLVAFEELVNSDTGLEESEDAKPQKQPSYNKSRISVYSRNMSVSRPEDCVGEAEVLDSFTSSVNGLQTAVLTANMVLSMSNIVSDCN